VDASVKLASAGMQCQRRSFLSIRPDAPEKSAAIPTAARAASSLIRKTAWSEGFFALTRFEWEQGAPGKRWSFGSKVSYRINVLERRQADNQVFFNGFSREIKCGLRWDRADGFGAMAEP
jgi:hypothetical protein